MTIKEFKSEILGSYPKEGLKEALDELLNIADDEKIDNDEIKELAEKDIYEYTDNLINPYTSDLLEWYNADLTRCSYGDEALKEGAENFIQLLTMGQGKYWEEKLSEVQQKIEDWIKTEEGK